MKLLYFSDISQLDSVLELSPNLVYEMKPITGDMAVAYELETRNINYIDEWSYISSLEIESNWNQAHSLCEHWFDRSASSIHYGAEPLNVSVRAELIYPFQACLNARTAYNNIFNSFSISDIYGFFLPPTPIIRTGPNPTERAVRSVSESVLFFLADKYNIRVNHLSSPVQLSSNLRRKSRLKSLSRQISSTNSKQEYLSSLNSVYSGSIVIYADLMSYAEFQAINSTLQSSLDHNLIPISQSQLAHWSSLVSSKSDIQEQLNICEEVFYATTHSFSVSYPEIFSNHFLRFQFQRIFQEMRTAVVYGDVFSAFLDLLQPSLALFGHEAFTIERVLVGLCQSRGIHTVSFLHGSIGPVFGRRGIVGRSDTIICPNERDVKSLVQFGVAEDRAVQIGSIHNEASLATICSKTAGDLDSTSRAKKVAKSSLGLSSSKPLVMITTANINTGYAAPVANPRAHRDTLRSLLLLISKRQDINFVIKAHPSFDHYELYRRIQSQGLGNLYFMESTSLDELTSASDICLMINYCTSAVLEAMFQKVPAVYLNNSVYPIHAWQDNMSESGLCRVTNVADLEHCIDRILTDPSLKTDLLAKSSTELNILIGTLDCVLPSRKLQVFLKELISARHSAQLHPYNSSPTLQPYLTSNIRHSIAPDTDLVNPHDNSLLLHIFSYVSGVLSLGESELQKFYYSIASSAEPLPLGSFRAARYTLLPGYIQGVLCSQFTKHSAPILPILIWPYFIRPHKLIFSTRNAKITLAKYLLRSLLRMHLLFSHYINCLAKHPQSLIPFIRL